MISYIKNNKKLYFLYCAIFAFALTSNHSLFPNTSFNAAYLMTGDLEFKNTMGYYNSQLWANSYTIYSLLMTFFIKLNFSILTIEFITTFSYTFVFLLGFYLISLAITKKNFLSLIFGLLIVFFEIDLDTIDYRTGYFDYSFHGTLANAYFILFLGFLANKNYFTAGFLAGSFYLIHAVIGIFILGSLALTIVTIFYFNKIYIKRLIYGILFGVLFLFLNLIFKFFFFKSLGISLYGFQNIDWELYRTFLLNWDWHRSHLVFRKLHIIFFIIFIIFIIFILFINQILKTKKNNRNLYIFNVFIIIAVIEGLILFFVFKKFVYPSQDLNLIELIFLIPIPPRFLNLTSTYIFIVYFSYCVFLADQYKTIKKYIIVFLILFISTTIYFNDIKLQKRTNIEKNHLQMNNAYKQIIKSNVWQKIKKLENEGSFIVHSNNYNYLFTPLTGKHNFLIFPNLDIVNYFPQYLKFMEMALKDIYQIKFDNPPQECKKSGGLQCDSYVKTAIEKNNKETWEYISKKYDIQGVILPDDWNISLDLTFKDKGISYYKLK